jgi:mobilome CxxCx(11)CxxC protein
MINFLGIATPALFGAVIAMQGTTWKYAPLALFMAGLLGVAQLALSIWSLVTGWEDSLAYAIESKAENYRLADEFEKLGQTQSLSDAEFEIEMQVLETQAEMRSGLDNRVDVSGQEKRMIMRAGLWKYQRPCVACREVPRSMKPTLCETCGDF